MTYAEYLSYIDYISENGKEQILSEYGYPADCPWDAETLQQVFDIMEAAEQNDLKNMLYIYGVSVATFCRQFDIPYKTGYKWVSGENGVSDYLIKMAAYIMIQQLPTIEE